MYVCMYVMLVCNVCMYVMYVCMQCMYVLLCVCMYVIYVCGRVAHACSCTRAWVACVQVMHGMHPYRPGNAMFCGAVRCVWFVCALRCIVM